MHIKVRNCNDGFRRLVDCINRADHHNPNPEPTYDHAETYRTASRNGPVIQVAEPVTVTYRHPRERVLFNKARDANCFFHVFESLWMIAGRNDVKPLKRYVSTIGQFSDDGKTFNGAYGYRWRNAKIADVWNTDAEPLQDQLKVIVDHLKRKPESRRAVLQMWNVEDDLLKIDTSKDVCCNLNAMFSIRKQELWQPTAQERAFGDSLFSGGSEMLYHKDRGPRFKNYLDMTVTNRSNDMIWGMLGANVVHFSFLQEYLAACLGVEVGKYHHFTNNLHVYTETNAGWTPDEWLQEYNPVMLCPNCYGSEAPIKAYVGHGECDGCTEKSNCLQQKVADYGWDKYEHTLFPLVRDVETFDREVGEFIDNTDPTRRWEEPFLDKVAAPMAWTYELHKRRDYTSALKACLCIEASDWREAAINWVTKRKDNHERKQATRTNTTGQ